MPLDISNNIIICTVPIRIREQVLHIISDPCTRADIRKPKFLLQMHRELTIKFPSSETFSFSHSNPGNA